MGREGKGEWRGKGEGEKEGGGRKEVWEGKVGKGPGITCDNSTTALYPRRGSTSGPVFSKILDPPLMLQF